jgi:ABC-2 type transport system permease protein
MSPFFTLAPWILIFLIPAHLCSSFQMRKTGTLECFNKTPEFWQIVNGKFLGAVLLIVMAIIPTFILCRVISSLGMPGKS